MLLTVPVILGIRLEFILFALTLGGVALFHKRTMEVALTGLAVLLILKLFFDPAFDFYNHLFGKGEVLDQIIHKDMRQGEWPVLLNLFGLLLGFAILAKIFEESKLPAAIPSILPDDWKGPFILLVMIFLLSTFLDNIAAAIIGGTIALVVFKGKVHLGYVAGIVAASNAGGAGSVIGDTTTTLMWIDGVSPLDVLHGFVASFTALIVFGIPASLQQHKYQRIVKENNKKEKVRYNKLVLVAILLISTIITNFYFDFPALGVWLALVFGMTITTIPWREARLALKGSIFLMSLVTCASLMPVEELPRASIGTAFGLGFVSAIFDNIPLTKLCLEQGGYDWGILAYSVGFGGSMIWFGSSAGVALTGLFPEARKTIDYVRNGWHVALAYVVGFLMVIMILGWQPHAPHKNIEPPKTILTKDN